MDKSSQYWLNTVLADFIMPGVRVFGNCIPGDFSQLSQDLQIPWLLKNPIGQVVTLQRFCKFNFHGKTRMFAYYLPSSVLALHLLLLLQKGWSTAPWLACSPRCQVLALINCQCCRVFCTAWDSERLIFVPNADLYKTGLILLSTTLHISSQAHAQMVLGERRGVSYGAC